MFSVYMFHSGDQDYWKVSADAWENLCESWQVPFHLVQEKRDGLSVVQQKWNWYNHCDEDFVLLVDSDTFPTRHFEMGNYSIYEVCERLTHFAAVPYVLAPNFNRKVKNQGFEHFDRHKYRFNTGVVLIRNCKRTVDFSIDLCRRFTEVTLTDDEVMWNHACDMQCVDVHSLHHYWNYTFVGQLGQPGFELDLFERVKILHFTGNHKDKLNDYLEWC